MFMSLENAFTDEIHWVLTFSFLVSIENNKTMQCLKNTWVNTAKYWPPKNQSETRTGLRPSQPSNNLRYFSPISNCVFYNKNI